jgi:hypothetical protein
MKSQSLGFETQRKGERIDIPFEFENNFIVVTILFQNLFPLKFIFDTGAEHTILCKKDFTEIMNISYHKEFKILGADMKTELKAYLARGLSLKVNNSYISAPKQDILVLDEDYFKLDEASGVKIAGILGADMFNRFVVKIDYTKRMISLFDSEGFSTASAKGFEQFDIEVKNGKPYLYPAVSVQGKDTAHLKILIDTGASLTFLLFTNTHPSLSLPSNYIRGTVGRGLGGLIEGFSGRISAMDISPTIRFQNLITSFQDVNVLMDSVSVASRNGILGSQLLSRFTIYIDYPHEKLYLRPNRNFKQRFKFDRSGLSLVAMGAELHTFMVNSVASGSPAHWADFRKYDEIISINRIPCSIYELQNINAILQGKVGKRLRIVVRRNGFKYVKYILLKDLI